MSRISWSVVGVLVLLALCVPDVFAEVKLPSWASNQSADQKIQTIGKDVVVFLGVVGGVVALIYGSIGAIRLMNGEDTGKRQLTHTAMGLVVLGSLYGIANLFV